MQIQPYSLALITVLSAFLGFILYDTWKLWIRDYFFSEARVKERVKMSKRKRAKWVKRWLQYEISEVLEEGYYKDKIDKHERDFWLQRIGSRLDMLDLLPSKSRIRYPDPEDLKTVISSRLSMHSRMKGIFDRCKKTVPTPAKGAE